MIESIATKYRLNHNQKKEAEEMIAELMLKDSSLLLNFFESFESDTNQISDAFITWLRERRYPLYSAYHKKLSLLLANIHNHNPYFRIVYNDNFESDEYEIAYINPSTSSKELAELKLTEKKEYLQELATLIKGNPND
ncbi:MAG: hypothetical protein WCH76_01065 [Candidatus Riflemargulisbacteria bacterium]